MKLYDVNICRIIRCQEDKLKELRYLMGRDNRSKDLRVKTLHSSNTLLKPSAAMKKYFT